MNDIIQLLPDSVANQIAAGEVIQRPANVVKELVENAVDAGATKIDVYITDAGRTAIQVVDNGKGMSETDARLAFERHATSKIRCANDLFGLATMGFRGEALPSIAAVCMVELYTRRACDDVGTELAITGSKVEHQRVCTCPVGCNIKVKNIFFNVPARRKFLKSNATELNNIITAFERIALVYPAIEFTFHSNDNELMNLRPGNTHKRIADIFGKKISQLLLPVEVDTTLCNITGFVGKPESARKKCAMQYFFVNGRYMKHVYFSKAVLAAYERLIPAGEQVPFFLYFTTDPATIDVNIHPAKTEIKFENEQPIYQLLAAAVREAIGIFSNIPSIDFDTEGMPDIPIFTDNLPTTNTTTTTPPPPHTPYDRQHTTTEHWDDIYDLLVVREPIQPSLFPIDETSHDTLPSQPTAFLQHNAQYILASVNSGLLVIDQHRAHIRVLYERYRQQISEQKPLSQRLLFPEAVRFTARHTVLLQTIIQEMELIGFELTPLGANNYAINAVPAGLDGINPSTLLTEMMDDAVSANATAIDDINHSLALSLAKKAAIPVGQLLTNNEMDNLLRELFACENVNYTPDGKKTFVIINDDDLSKFLI